MDLRHALARAALDAAHDALQAAAAELLLASALAHASPVANDARVLALAVEREVLAVGAALARHG